jgi:hypothetical protein
MTQKGPVTAFPTAAQGLALQASLLDGDAALEAWRALSIESQAGDVGIGWISPLLMTNIRRLRPNDPWVLANPHFLALCELKARAGIATAVTTLNALREAGVDTLALKGLALGHFAYPSPGLRSISDFDILVPARDFSRATEALKLRGLRAAPGAPVRAADFRRNHAHVFFGARRHEPTLDLHWHVLASARGDDDDQSFWRESRPLVVGTAETRCLCLEDQLLHVLVHGVRWTRVPHVRWVADATMLLRLARAGFRLDRFLEVIERFEAVTPVQEGLAFVANLLGEGRDIQDAVSRLKPSRFSKRAFKARATSYEDRTVADRIALRLETALWTRRASKKNPAR